MDRASPTRLARREIGRYITLWILRVPLWNSTINTIQRTLISILTLPDDFINKEDEEIVNRWDQARQRSRNIHSRI